MIKLLAYILLILLSSCVFAQTPFKLNTMGEMQTPENMYVTKAGERVLVPETHISLIPPEHYMFSTELKGFFHPGTSSTIQLNEIIGTSYIMVCKGITPEYMQEQGLVLKDKVEITTKDGHSGYLYTLNYSSKGVDYEKLMLFAGDYNNTIWANISYPVVSRSFLFEPLKECLLTAQFEK